MKPEEYPYFEDDQIRRIKAYKHDLVCGWMGKDAMVARDLLGMLGEVCEKVEKLEGRLQMKDRMLPDGTLKVLRSDGETEEIKPQEVLDIFEETAEDCDDVESSGVRCREDPVMHPNAWCASCREYWLRGQQRNWTWISAGRISSRG